MTHELFKTYSNDSSNESDTCSLIIFWILRVACGTLQSIVRLIIFTSECYVCVCNEKIWGKRAL